MNNEKFRSDLKLQLYPILFNNLEAYYNVMKMYTNIKNGSQHSMNKSQQIPTNIFSPEQSNNNPSSPQEIKPFKKETNEHLEIGQNRLNIFMLPTHISIVGQEYHGQSFNQGVISPKRKLTPRKKIFCPENILFKLKEPSSQQNQQLFVNRPAENDKCQKELRPPQQLNSNILSHQKFNVSQVLKQNVSKVGEKNIQRSGRYRNFQTNYDKEYSIRILTEPIISEDKIEKSSSLGHETRYQNITKSQVQAKIPYMLEKIDRNQQAIRQLIRKFDDIVRLQNQRHVSLRKELKYKERIYEQKQSTFRSRIQCLQNQQHLLKSQNISCHNLQREQANRINELIAQNNILSKKILEQRTKNRIAGLQLRRQILSKGKMKKLSNLDISIIPLRQSHYFAKTQKILPTNQPPTPFTNDNYCCNQSVRQVKVTKMY